VCKFARLYTSKRGKSGSTRPVSKKPPAWFKYASEEVESLILKLAREGNSPSMIGVILRDRYGIPLVKHVLGKTVNKFLKDSGQAPRIPEDLDFLLKKAESMRKHLDKNRKDYHNKRGLTAVESKIHRLIKYYKERGVLAPEWEYKPMVASVR
jgi:small subunit ribosomal protein S15